MVMLYLTKKITTTNQEDLIIIGFNANHLSNAQFEIKIRSRIILKMESVQLSHFSVW